LAHGGFEKFYGFLARENNQWYPEIYDGVTPVPTSDDPEYHFIADADQATVGEYQNRPDKPFFILTLGYPCSHHVPGKWADKYGAGLRRLGQAWSALPAKELG
jgi:arylsulfatase